MTEINFSGLSENQLLAFGKIFFERTFVLYQLFSKENNFGNSDKLLAFVKDIVFSFGKTTSISEEQVSSLLILSPDADDFSIFETAQTIDVCSIVFELLNFTDKDGEHIINISNLCKDIIYKYVVHKSKGSITDSDVYQSNEMQREKEMQQIIINDIQNNSVKKEYQNILNI